jgi:hypothetical protein
LLLSCNGKQEQESSGQSTSSGSLNYVSVLPAVDSTVSESTVSDAVVPTENDSDAVLTEREVDEPAQPERQERYKPIERTYYGFTIGETQKSSAFDRVRSLRFKLINNDDWFGLDRYSYNKTFTWNNIKWDGLELSFKGNTLVGICFCVICKTEHQSKYLLSKATKIYLDKYKYWFDDTTENYNFFRDRNTIMEIYGGPLDMYLLIMDSSAYDSMN